MPSVPADASEPTWARWLVRGLTFVHGFGSLVLAGMTVFVLLDFDDRWRLATTPGGRVLVEVTGPFLPLFFVALSIFLAALAWGSHKRQVWSWPAAVGAYSIGVVGSLWQVSVGFRNGWVALLVNSSVLAALLVPPVRRMFRPRPPINGMGQGARP